MLRQFQSEVGNSVQQRGSQVNNEVNTILGQQVGLNSDTVNFLRSEFKKFGRNPMDSTLEIVALENGLDENKVKTLFQLHIAQLRKNDGLSPENRSIYD